MIMMMSPMRTFDLREAGWSLELRMGGCLCFALSERACFEMIMMIPRCALRFWNTVLV